MAEAKAEDIRRLSAEIGDLETTQEDLAKQSGDLKQQKEIADQLAQTSHIPSPDGSAADVTPSLTAQLRARDLEKQIDRVQGEQVDVDAQLGDARKELDSTKLELAGEDAEREIEQTRADVETVVELGEESLNHADLFPGELSTGGTSGQIADAVAYARHVTMPYVKDVVIPHFEAISEDLAKPYEVSDELKLMHEKTMHEKEMGELGKMKEDAAKMKEKELSEDDAKKAIEDTKARFKEQDQAREKTQEESRVKDESLRQQQDDQRKAMDKERNEMRQGVVTEVLEPLAKQQVQQEHADVVKSRAMDDAKILEPYKAGLEGMPNGAEAYKKFEQQVEGERKEFQQSLEAKTPEDVQKKIAPLQQQHFPEVPVPAPAPAMAGPGGAGPGFPGAGGAGSGPAAPAPAAPPPPQRQGPQM